MPFRFSHGTRLSRNRLRPFGNQEKECPSSTCAHPSPSRPERQSWLIFKMRASSPSVGGLSCTLFADEPTILSSARGPSGWEAPNRRIRRQEPSVGERPSIGTGSSTLGWAKRYSSLCSTASTAQPASQMYRGSRKRVAPR